MYHHHHHHHYNTHTYNTHYIIIITTIINIVTLVTLVTPDSGLFCQGQFGSKERESWSWDWSRDLRRWPLKLILERKLFLAFKTKSWQSQNPGTLAQSHHGKENPPRAYWWLKLGQEDWVLNCNWQSLDWTLHWKITTAVSQEWSQLVRFPDPQWIGEPDLVPTHHCM